MKIKTIFVRTPAVGYRLLVLVLISLAVILIDHRYHWLDQFKFYLTEILSPVVLVSSVPHRIGDWADLNLKSRTELIEEVKQLRARDLALSRRAQKMASLSAENVRLRELLNSSKIVEERVLVAEVLALDPDPFRHKILINKGMIDAIKDGQPVLDARGLMGQVVSVNPSSAWVLSIADTSHALPVQVNRNGVRAIAVGSGHLDHLWLSHVPNTADIQVGDLLVSSGLGGKFPVGYPVATVVSIDKDPGKTFAKIKARPESELDRGRHLLVVSIIE